MSETITTLDGLKWQENDKLRDMTSKHNQTVDAVQSLRESSTQVNQATEKKFTDMQTSIDEQFQQVNEELEQKVSSVTATDIGLGNVTNTSDEDKPVSIAQAEAIAQAKAEALAEQLTSSEEELIDPDSSESDPEISPMVAALISELIQEIGAQSEVTSYGIASKLVLGVVKASDDIEVDSETGRMTVAGYTLLKVKVQSLVTGVGTLEQLETTAKTDLVSAVNELFQYVSNGKQLVSSAITDRGVATASTATFQQMATNIMNLDLTEQKYLWHVPADQYSNNLASIPYPFQDGQAVIFNGELHILGGYVNGTSYGTNHYKWDGTSWTKVSTIPIPFQSGKAVVVRQYEGNPEIHIFGGTVSNYLNHYKWDGTSWTKVSDLPSGFGPIAAIAVTQINGDFDIIHIFSGTAHYLMRYGLYSTEWVKLANMPYNITRSNSAATVVDNQIYLVTSPTSSSCYFLVLSGADWTICDQIFTPVKYIDYSESKSTSEVTMCTYNSYPHMVPIERLKGVLIFTGQYNTSNSMSQGRTFVRGVRVGLEEQKFNTLFAYPQANGGYQGGEFVIDEERQKLYIIGGSYNFSTTRSFIDISYEIYAKVSNSQ